MFSFDPENFVFTEFSYTIPRDETSSLRAFLPRLKMDAVRATPSVSAAAAAAAAENVVGQD